MKLRNLILALSFQRGADGTVQSVTFRQNGQNAKGMKQ
jgi:hypothetical protein